MKNRQRVMMVIAALASAAFGQEPARLRVMAGNPLIFNFGPVGEALPEGVVEVGTTLFSSQRGWGWVRPPDTVRKRDKSPDILRDTLVGASPAMQQPAEFKMVMEPGEYEIEVMLGDPSFAYTAILFLQDERTPWIDEGRKPQGSAVIRRRKIHLPDGELRIRIPPAHSRGTPFCSLNYLIIRTAEPEGLIVGDAGGSSPLPQRGLQRAET